MNNSIILDQVAQALQKYHITAYLEHGISSEQKNVTEEKYQYFLDKYLSANSDGGYSLDDFCDDANIDYVEVSRDYLKEYSGINADDLDEIFDNYENRELLNEVIKMLEF